MVGFGNIGKLVAQIGKAMGMEVCAYDKFIEAHVMQEKGIKPLATIEDVFEECHYISLHIPAVSDTKGLSRLPFTEDHAEECHADQHGTSGSGQ